ncbi:MAG: hypothetical protein HY782_25150 [Chloroflexi bacterium]|nr:hypothetical protein [Chloroflexota bacterium]
MKAIMVEVIAYAPTQYFHCQHCEVVWKQADISSVEKFHKEAVESSIPPEMMKEYQAVSDWVIEAVERFGGRVVFKVIDAASMEGLLKSVRYGVRKYPAVIVDGKAKHTGADFKQAETLISQRLLTQPA